jgi:nitroreductase
MKPFQPPAFGEELPPAHPSEQAICALRLRRSTPIELIGDPGPAPEELESMLAIAARVPDHRRVVPFRFIVIEGEGRTLAGEILAEAFALSNPDADEAKLALERRRLQRAPVVVAVVARLDAAHKTPEWEQSLTVGACCQNLLHAASAHGYAAQWITEWCAYDAQVSRRFGLTTHERFAGFVYLGTARENPRERLRPDLSGLLTRFGGERAQM